MLPAGSWKLDAATLPRLDSNSSGDNASSKHGQQQASSDASSTQPPRAIFVRLSDELLQQLKAAQSGNQGAAAFQLELGGPSSPGNATANASASGSGSSKGSVLAPVAINLGENSYPLVKPVKNNNQTRNQVTDILIQPSSNNVSSSSSLQLAASNIHDQYEVGPSKSIRHKEKTAANMGERIRERNAQMQKEKESRKIVIVEDDGFSSSGGKGKKASSKVGKAQPNLLRANAINAKRSASPAGVASRQSPSLAPSATLTSTIPRPPSRLVANEAAKGLMKKSNMLQNVLGTANVPKAPIPPVDTASIAFSPDEKPSLPPNTQAVVQQMPSSSEQDKPSMPVATVEKPKLASGQTHGSPVRRQYHQMKVDADDLASASSDSEDDDDKPLAVRTQSPIKTHFQVEQLSNPVASLPLSEAKVVSAKTHPTTIKDVHKAIPKPLIAESSSTSSSESSDKETPQVPRTVTPAASAVVPKRLSPDSAPNSRGSSPARATGGPKAVAKTSGGSRLSKPVPKVSPRTSPKPAPVVAPVLPPDSGTSVTSTSSASTSRPSTPPSNAVKPAAKSEPVQSESVAHKPTTLSVEDATKPTSRASSPLLSPTTHPLPAKPPVSPSFKRYDTLQQSPSRPSPTSPALAGSALEKDKSPSSLLPRPSALSIGLPANPITGVMPNIPKSPSSLHPSHSNLIRSPHSTPGVSPIISNFPSSTTARGSKSPSSGPLRTTTNGLTATKRKDGPATDQTKSSLLEGASSKKLKLDGGKALPVAPSPLSATTGSEEDGEAEEEEGEYRASPEIPLTTLTSAKASAKEDKMDGGRSDNAKAVQDELTKLASVEEKPKIINKSGLPSFTKKGRMSELQKEKGRDDSHQPRSQSASRANTPISNDSMDIVSIDGSQRANSTRYKPKFTGRLRITDDADFAQRRAEFKEKLYPEYARLYTKLEKLKDDLSNSKGRGSSPPLDVSPQQIARMVEEVNERSEELERIKLGLWQYDDDKKNRKDGSLRNKMK